MPGAAADPPAGIATITSPEAARTIAAASPASAVAPATPVPARPAIAAAPATAAVPAPAAPATPAPARPATAVPATGPSPAAPPAVSALGPAFRPDPLRPLAVCAPPSALVAPIISFDRLAAAIASERRVRIVAIGSSTTEGVGASSPAYSYPALLSSELGEARPDIGWSVYGRGIGGEDVAETFARFDDDVLTLRPALVIWQIGSNAAMRGTDPGHFRTLVKRGVEMLKAAGADVILMNPQFAPRLNRRPHLARFTEALAQIAVKTEAALFPRYELMRFWVETRGVPLSSLLVEDELHHGDFGYACIAQALARMVLAGLPDRDAAPRAEAPR